MYGGNLYGRSAQLPSDQARAQSAACARWGAGPSGRELIAHSVCKGKYQPWRNGERMYGCFRHHAIRKRRIEKAGVHPQWESFEQWPAREEPATQ